MCARWWIFFLLGGAISKPTHCAPVVFGPERVRGDTGRTRGDFAGEILEGRGSLGEMLTGDSVVVAIKIIVAVSFVVSLRSSLRLEVVTIGIAADRR